MKDVKDMTIEEMLYELAEIAERRERTERTLKNQTESVD